MGRQKWIYMMGRWRDMMGRWRAMMDFPFAVNNCGGVGYMLWFPGNIRLCVF